MTQQEIFNRALRGILEQGEPGARQVNIGRDEPKFVTACAYHIPREGQPALMCSVGHIVGEETAKLLIDQDYFMSIDLEEFPEIAQYFDEGDFIEALQAAHDEAAKTSDFTPSFIKGMEAVARHYNLEYPE